MNIVSEMCKILCGSGLESALNFQKEDSLCTEKGKFNHACVHFILYRSKSDYLQLVELACLCT